MPENIEIEFVNREYELNDLCRPITLKTVVEAPAGFGKTYLLRAVKKRFLAEQAGADPNRKSRNGCAIVDLQDYSGTNGPLKMIDDIAQQIDGNKVKSTELERAYEELAGRMGNYSSILLLFDSVERSDSDTLKWLYETFIEEELYNALHPRLKIVFAGRHLKNLRGNTDRLVKRYLPKWDGYNFTELKPFSEGIIEEFLRKRYEATKGDPRDVHKERFENWSNGIMELSGGHPRTIRKLADYLSDPNGANWVADFTTATQKERRYKDIVEKEIEEVLKSIDDEVARNDLMRLSIFRIFNLDTIEYLKSSGEFDKTRDALEIFLPLARNGLVKKYPNSIFYSDSLIRNLVLLKLRYEKREDYLRINDSALNYYNGLIDEARAEYRKAISANKIPTLHYFAEYTREAILHLSLMPESSPAVLEDNLRRYANNFKEVGLARDDENCGEQIDKLIWDDTEIVRAIGKEQLENLLIQLNNTQVNAPAFIGNQPEATVSKPVSSQKIKVLFLAANPKETMRIHLDEEIRAIKYEILLAQKGQFIEIILELAVRPNDIIRLLNEHTPDIVHFSGHGSSTGEILLVDKTGERSHPVTSPMLKGIFSSAKVKVRMVVLNACYSTQIAEPLTEVVDFAIGTDKAIGDEAAMAFAAKFYSGLIYENSVQQAFAQGVAAVSIEDPNYEKVLGLKCATGVDPSNIYFINSQ